MMPARVCQGECGAHDFLYGALAGAVMVVMLWAGCDSIILALQVG